MNRPPLFYNTMNPPTPQSPGQLFHEAFAGQFSLTSDWGRCQRDRYEKAASQFLASLHPEFTPELLFELLKKHEFYAHVPFEDVMHFTKGALAALISDLLALLPVPKVRVLTAEDLWKGNQIEGEYIQVMSFKELSDSTKAFWSNFADRLSALHSKPPESTPNQKEGENMAHEDKRPIQSPAKESDPRGGQNDPLQGLRGWAESEEPPAAAQPVEWEYAWGFAAKESGWDHRECRVVTISPSGIGELTFVQKVNGFVDRDIYRRPKPQATQQEPVEDGWEYADGEVATTQQWEIEGV